MSDAPQQIDYQRLLQSQSQQASQVRQMRGPQSIAYFNQAMQDLGLTPQEQYLYQHHLNNLMGTGKVTQGQDISTVLQAVVTGPDGRYYNIPTVWGGQVLSPEAAQQQAAKIGWDKWPAYDTPKAADDRYEKMHEYLGKDVQAYQKQQSAR